MALDRPPVRPPAAGTSVLGISALTTWAVWAVLLGDDAVTSGTLLVEGLSLAALTGLLLVLIRLFTGDLRTRTCLAFGTLFPLGLTAAGGSPAALAVLGWGTPVAASCIGVASVLALFVWRLSKGRLPTGPRGVLLWWALVGGGPLSALALAHGRAIYPEFSAAALAPFQAAALAPLYVPLLAALSSSLFERRARRRARQRAWGGAVFALVGIAVASLWLAPVRMASEGRTATAPLPSRPGPDPEAPDLLLVTVEGLRADGVEWFLADGPTPTTAALGASALVATRATAQSPDPLVSLGTLWSGRAPSELPGHSVPGPDGSRPPLQLPDVQLLPSVMRQAGYRTVAVTAGSELSSRSPFAGHFEHYDNVEERRQLRLVSEGLPLSSMLFPSAAPAERHGLEARLQRAGEVVDDERQRDEEGDLAPLFLWVHLNDLSLPLETLPVAPRAEGGEDYLEVLRSGSVDRIRGGSLPVTPPEQALWRAGYTDRIRALDAALAPLLAAWDELGAGGGAVAMMGTSGTEFWEHGGFGAAHGMWAQLVDIPMVVRAPGVASGRLLEERVTPPDLTATLASIGRARGLPFPGRDLLGDVLPAPVRISRNTAYSAQVADLDGGWKVVWTPAFGIYQVYDLRNDPSENHDLWPAVEAWQRGVRRSARGGDEGPPEVRAWTRARARLEGGGSPAGG